MISYSFGPREPYSKMNSAHSVKNCSASPSFDACNLSKRVSIPLSNSEDKYPDDRIARERSHRKYDGAAESTSPSPVMHRMGIVESPIASPTAPRMPGATPELDAATQWVL